MSIKSYQEEMRKETAAFLGKDYTVEAVQVPKNNGVTRSALQFRRKGSPLMPMMYLEDLYEVYLEDGGLRIQADTMAKYVRKCFREVRFPMDIMDTYEKTRDRLFLKLVNKERNQEMLSKMPYREVMDLALIPYCLVESSYAGRGTVQVRHEIIRHWGVDPGEMLENAWKNTRRMLPCRIRSMSEALQMFGGYTPDRMEQSQNKETGPEPVPASEQMYILSCEPYEHGAAAMLYPEMPEMAAEMFSGDFFILPSSVHECILIPENSGCDVRYLQEVVRQVNRDYVLEEDVLSDSVYKYSHAERKILICS